MLRTVIFIIVPRWKQTKCSSVGEWIHQVWYIHTMEYHSAIKGDKLQIHAITWLNLRCVMLSERSWTQKDILNDSICMASGKGKPIGME